MLLRLLLQLQLQLQLLLFLPLLLLFHRLPLPRRSPRRRRRGADLRRLKLSLLPLSHLCSRPPLCRLPKLRPSPLARLRLKSGDVPPRILPQLQLLLSRPLISLQPCPLLHLRLVSLRP